MKKSFLIFGGILLLLVVGSTLFLDVSKFQASIFGDVWNEMKLSEFHKNIRTYLDFTTKENTRELFEESWKSWQEERAFLVGIKDLQGNLIPGTMLQSDTFTDEHIEKIQEMIGTLQDTNSELQKVQNKITQTCIKQKTSTPCP